MNFNSRGGKNRKKKKKRGNIYIQANELKHRETETIKKRIGKNKQIPS